VFPKTREVPHNLQKNENANHIQGRISLRLNSPAKGPSTCVREQGTILEQEKDRSPSWSLSQQKTLQPRTWCQLLSSSPGQVHKDRADGVSAPFQLSSSEMQSGCGSETRLQVCSETVPRARCRRSAGGPCQGSAGAALLQPGASAESLASLDHIPLRDFSLICV